MIWFTDRWLKARVGSTAEWTITAAEDLVVQMRMHMQQMTRGPRSDRCLPAWVAASFQAQTSSAILSEAKITMIFAQSTYPSRSQLATRWIKFQISIHRETKTIRCSNNIKNKASSPDSRLGLHTMVEMQTRIKEIETGNLLSDPQMATVRLSKDRSSRAHLRRSL